MTTMIEAFASLRVLGESLPAATREGNVSRKVSRSFISRYAIQLTCASRVERSCWGIPGHLRPGTFQPDMKSFPSSSLSVGARRCAGVRTHQTPGRERLVFHGLFAALSVETGLLCISFDPQRAGSWAKLGWAGLQQLLLPRKRGRLS